MQRCMRVRPVRSARVRVRPPRAQGEARPLATVSRCDARGPHCMRGCCTARGRRHVRGAVAPCVCGGGGGVCGGVPAPSPSSLTQSALDPTKQGATSDVVHSRVVAARPPDAADDALSSSSCGRRPPTEPGRRAEAQQSPRWRHARARGSDTTAGAAHAS